MTTRLSICRDFAEKQWELPIDGPRLLIAWPEIPGCEDEAVPGTVQNLLCRSMTSGHDVAWLGGEELSGVESRRLTPGLRAWPENIWRRLTGRPQDAWLLRSGDAARAERLFDAMGFCWSQRGQIALLIPPAISFEPERAQLLASIGTQKLAPLETLWSHGAAACVLPGVDGCVAGVYARNPQAIDGFTTTLKTIAAASDVKLEECEEANLFG
ncbi:hypothetical protein [Denitrobaculum tricleocarpae]|uniref:Uncharacterized protein n=1 Tax=Denitrobaculum tricleocarpae TaxID=2591009 RepID=A0A545U2R8_9PROT|nr:hypothetical protein [Denitrobaculum tricleocarpae]TQV83769.1 hypothetical protein FKG95_04090 [Denitrobaculum tricleocarpae]